MPGPLLISVGRHQRTMWNLFLQHKRHPSLNRKKTQTWMWYNHTCVTHPSPLRRLSPFLILCHGCVWTCCHFVYTALLDSACPLDTRSESIAVVYGLASVIVFMLLTVLPGSGSFVCNTLKILNVAPGWMWISAIFIALQDQFNWWNLQLSLKAEVMLPSKW